MNTLPADAMRPHATPDTTPTEPSGVAPAPRPPRAVDTWLPKPSETATPQADGTYTYATPQADGSYS